MPTEFLEFIDQERDKESFLKWIGQQKKVEPKQSFLDFIDTEKQAVEAKAGELLSAAQEKVGEVGAWESDPKKWTSEFWSSLGEVWRETPAAQFFTKDFWSETGKNLLTQTADMMKTETITPIGKQRALVEKAIATYRAFTGEEELPTPIKQAGLQAKGGAEFILFIPRMLVGLAKDPVTTIRENPLDMLFLTALFGGAKAYRNIKAKRAKMGWVTTGDMINPIKNSKFITPELKQVLQKVPADMEIEMPVSGALEIIKTKKGGTSPIYKHWWEGVKADIAKAGDLPDRPLKFGTKKYPSIGFRVPIRVFEYFPWLKRLLYDEWRAGEFNYHNEFAGVTRELKAWKKELPRKSQKRVGIYADYMQEGGAELMKHLGEKLPELTPQEMKYYNWGQKLYADLLPRINQSRALAGEKPIGKVQNYSTWIRNLRELPDLGIDITKASAEQVNFHLNSIPLAFAKHRARGIVRAGIELDYGLLLENYSNQALRHVHLTPTIARARALLEPFNVKGMKKWDMFKETPRLATWIEEWTDTIAGQKSAIPKGRSGLLVRGAQMLNRNIAMAILSWNLRSALIQPSAFKNSFVYLGGRFLVEGFQMNLSKKWRAFAAKNSQHLRLRKQYFDAHAKAMTEVGRKIGQPKLMRGYSMGKRAVAQAGMYPLQLLDYQTAQATWLGAYEMAVKKMGYKEGGKRAFRYADDVVVKTQASAQVGDIAPIQRTPTGKLFTLFQTFVINEWDMVTHDVFGYKRPYDLSKMRNRAADISRFVMATAVVNAVYEGIFKVRSPYGAPEWEIYRAIKDGQAVTKTVGRVAKELIEGVPVIGGMARWSTPHRTPTPAFLQVAYFDPAQMINRLIEKPELTSDQIEWLGKILGIPGTSQIRKYITRRKKGMNHIEAMMGVRAEGDRKKEPGW